MGLPSSSPQKDASPPPSRRRQRSEKDKISSPQKDINPPEDKDKSSLPAVRQKSERAKLLALQKDSSPPPVVKEKSDKDQSSSFLKDKSPPPSAWKGLAGKAIISLPRIDENPVVQEQLEKAKSPLKETPSHAEEAGKSLSKLPTAKPLPAKEDVNLKDDKEKEATKEADPVLEKPRRGRKAKNPKHLAAIEVPEVVTPAPSTATKKKDETPIKPILKPAVFIPKTDEKKSDAKEPVAKKASTETSSPSKEKNLPSPVLPSVKRVPSEPAQPPTEKNDPKSDQSTSKVVPPPESTQIQGKKSPQVVKPHPDEKQSSVKSKTSPPVTEKSAPQVPVVDQKSKKDDVADKNKKDELPIETVPKPAETEPPVVAKVPTSVPIKKRGRPSTKNEPVEKTKTPEKVDTKKDENAEKATTGEKTITAEKTNKAEKINKATIETETDEEDENPNPFLNVKGRKGKIGRAVTKLLQDIEQLLVYQEKQSRLRNKTLLDLPEAVLLMKKYKKKKRRKRKTYLIAVDKSAPMKMSLKRQRKAKLTMQRSSDNLLKFKLLRQAKGVSTEENIEKPKKLPIIPTLTEPQQPKVTVTKPTTSKSAVPVSPTVPEDVSLKPKKRGRPPKKAI